MRISTGATALRSARLVAVCSSLVVGACSGNGTFPGPSWNLTGAKDAAQLPAKPVTPTLTQQPPSAAYRGERDRMTGLSQPFGAPPQAYPMPPAQPPSTAQPQLLPPPAQSIALARAPKLRAGQVEVRPGQSLAVIASEQRVSIAALMAANKLRDPYVIPGQVLTIPRP